jgi:2-oxo-4-hydroxy-4-carboxy-5-ureidoimidazoline decarboxylase
MAEPHAVLDALPREEARQALLRCCGSRRWALGMLERRPFGSEVALVHAAELVWESLAPGDYLEAFAEHPPIGGDLGALQAKFAATAAWSSAEQAGVALADEQTLAALAAANRAYRERFGFTFIVCASGKSAREMLGALERRLDNERPTEFLVAAREQAKITWLRLQKLGREQKAEGSTQP